MFQNFVFKNESEENSENYLLESLSNDLYCKYQKNLGSLKVNYLEKTTKNQTCNNTCTYQNYEQNISSDNFPLDNYYKTLIIAQNEEYGKMEEEVEEEEKINVNEKNKEENEKKEEKDEKEMKATVNIQALENNNIIKCFSEEDISKLFSEKEEFIRVKDYFRIDEVDQDIKNTMTFISKKRKRRTKYEIEIDRIQNENNEKKSTKKGRNPKDPFKESTEKQHDKSSADNIIKKVKKNLFQFLRNNINSSLSQNNEQYALAKLDYSFINQLKRETDLQYLQMTTQKLLSKKISPKYKCSECQNEKNIEEILKKKEDNEYIHQILNLTFDEWIDIFTLKKESDIKINGIGKLLEDIIKKNKKNDKIDYHYFSNFVYCLYNYKNWFLAKKGEKRKSKSK